MSQCGPTWTAAVRRVSELLRAKHAPAADADPIATLVQSANSDLGAVKIADISSALDAAFNGADAADNAAPLDVKSIDFSTADYAQIAQHFAGARLIVGAHGSGLSGLLFAPKDAVVVELLSAPDEDSDDAIVSLSVRGSPLYADLSARLGLRYVAAFATSAKDVATTAVQAVRNSMGDKSPTVSVPEPADRCKAVNDYVWKGDDANGYFKVSFAFKSPPPLT